jgi:hypothetical protein
MRIYNRFERSFVGLLALLLMWSAPRYAGDAFFLWREGRTGMGLSMAVVLGELTFAGLFFLVAIRGTAPRWMDRFDLHTARSAPSREDGLSE